MYKFFTHQKGGKVFQESYTYNGTLVLYSIPWHDPLGGASRAYLFAAHVMHHEEPATFALNIPDSAVSKWRYYQVALRDHHAFHGPLSDVESIKVLLPHTYREIETSLSTRFGDDILKAPFRKKEPVNTRSLYTYHRLARLEESFSVRAYKEGKPF